MANSTVELCNRALDLIGTNSITSLNDNSKAARLCNRNFGPVRDAVLRSYPWNCAMTRARLPALVTAPAFGYARAFQLPQGPDPAYCLRVWEINGEPAEDIDYQIEGRTIVTDEAAPLDIRYVARIEDPTLFDPLLDDAIAARLAVDIAFSLVSNATLVTELRNAYVAKMNEARMIDAREGKIRVETYADQWIGARR